MPPKSASKKDQILWYLCEKCRIHVTSKDRETHEKYCPQPSNPEFREYSYIQNKKMFVNSVNLKPAIDDLRDLTEAQLNRMIFISESAIELCGFILQDYVLIRSPQFPNQVPIVRTVWPVPNRMPSMVSITEEEWSTTWNESTDLKVIIEKLPFDPCPAVQVTLTPDRQQFDLNASKDLSRALNRELCHNVYCSGLNISIEFFNKKFNFIVDSIVGKEYSVELPDLEQRLAALNLKDSRFYLMTRSTRYSIKMEISKEEKTNEDNPHELSLFGGLDHIIKELRDMINLAFGRTKSIQGIKVTRTALIYGLAGCGKSLLCDALAAECNAEIIKFNASDIFSKYFGETEANLLNYFQRAFENYPKSTIIFIEEIVNICAKENKEDSAKRVSSAFLNVLDRVHQQKEGSRTFVLTTTSNIENINPAARRCGRLDIEIEIPVPNPEAREDILQKHLLGIQNNLSEDDIKWLANSCHGFVGADLASMISKAAAYSISQCKNDQNDDPILKLVDIHHVFAQIKPSAMREVLIESPNVKWSDIGGQKDLILQLKQAIEWPLTHPETFTRLGIKPPRGILMFGPPGCSKTMIAKALATESKVNFLSIKGPELFSMWVGESEKAVRELFRKARQVAPAIIFFDEIDAISGERSGTGSGSSVKERVLAQMLTEMDGVNVLSNVTIVAATNRPDLIDKALMRPGRIDRIVYVRLPDEQTRQDIFRIKFAKMPIDQDVDVGILAEKTKGFSGAEIEAVCQEAALNALECNLDATIVSWQHFEKALKVVQPRTSGSLLTLYDEYLKTY